MLAGTDSTGGVTSPVERRIVTPNDRTAALPCASVAVQLIVVVPIGNVDPDARPAVGAETQIGVIDPSTRSLAVGSVKASTFPAGSAVVSVMPAGTVSTGAVVSTTVTANDALAALPCPSVARQLTDVLPNGNVAPEA